MKKYCVMVADLNSLYDDKPLSPVLREVVSTKEEAEKLVQELQTHDMAAWFELGE